MSLHKLFPFFFQHFYCLLQFLHIIFLFIRLPFQSSCLRQQQWGSFQILISFINKIFKFLIKMLIYFWKILRLSFHICNFFIYDFKIMISSLTFFFLTVLYLCFFIFNSWRFSRLKNLFNMSIVSGFTLQEIMWSVIIQCAFNDSALTFSLNNWSLKLNPLSTAAWPWLRTKTSFKTKDSSWIFLYIDSRIEVKII